jgi:hypothetical protein
MLCILKLVNLFRSLSYCLSCLRLHLYDSTLFPRCCVLLVCISVDYYSWLFMLCCILFWVVLTHTHTREDQQTPRSETKIQRIIKDKHIYKHRRWLWKVKWRRDNKKMCHSSNTWGRQQEIKIWFWRKLRGYWIMVMVATILSRTFCLLICYRKIYKLEYTRL